MSNEETADEILERIAASFEPLSEEQLHMIDSLFASLGEGHSD